MNMRTGRVVVGGASSDPMGIFNTVFQGTVLGPPLWNTFFADVALAASATGGQEEIYADDLNVFKKFDRATPNDEIVENMQTCRQDVHRWGKRNRVSFDPAKEHILIIHPASGDGEVFRLLGCMTDCKLTMVPAIEKILVQIKPKITPILRTKAFYSTNDFIRQFKSHIWV